jgi:creatinine amidohydrolase
MTRTRKLAELRATQLAELLGPASVLLQPIAAVEQHGPHLPLSTDLLFCEAAATDVVERHGEELDLWLLPSLAYGKSTEHEWSPGTVSLSTATLLAVLDDLGRSLSRLATKRLVFVNSHGGNVALLGVALRDLRQKYGLMTFLLNVLAPPAYSPSAGAGSGSGEREVGLGIHAGRDETSLMLHLRPDLVEMSAVAGYVPSELGGLEHVRFGGDTSFGWLSDDLSGCGVIGDPSGASAERGAALFRSMTERLAASLAEVGRFGFDAPRS